MIALLIGGTVVFCVGLLTVVFGIPIKEFSFGNTMILAGAVMSCTGLILIGLYFVAREFRSLGRHLEAGLPADAGLLAPFQSPREPGAEAPALPARAASEPSLTPRPMPPRTAREDTLFTRDQPRDLPRDRADADLREDQGRAPLDQPEMAPWRDHPVTRAQNPVSPDAEASDVSAETPSRQRRNIMFSSYRRDRSRDVAPRDPEQPLDDSPEKTAAEEFAHRDPEPDGGRAFDIAWPQPEKARSDSSFRPARTAPPPNADQTAPEPVRERFQPPRRADASSVTVVKSGVVDSMAYSLYSDGSIEAQMPEGMVRFASIDELRAHLDHRG